MLAGNTNPPGQLSVTWHFLNDRKNSQQEAYKLPFTGRSANVMSMPMLAAPFAKYALLEAPGPKKSPSTKAERRQKWCSNSTPMVGTIGIDYAEIYLPRQSDLHKCLLYCTNYNEQTDHNR